MIEDKELGLKVAEDKEEEFWIKTRDRLQADTEQNERIIEMNNWVMERINKEKLKGGSQE